MRAPIEAKLSTKGLKDDEETSPKFVLPKCIKAPQSHMELLSKGQPVPYNDDHNDQLLKSWNSAARKRAMVCIDVIFDRNCESGKLFEGNLEMNGLFIFCSTLKALRWAMKCFGFIILINTLDTTLIRPD